MIGFRARAATTALLLAAGVIACEPLKLPDGHYKDDPADDAGVPDAGPIDSGVVDAGIDAGAEDAGQPDGGPPDAGPIDSGAGDAGPEVEEMCPGGANPDPNVVFCDGFEDGSWLRDPVWDPWPSAAGTESVVCDGGFRTGCALRSSDFVENTPDGGYCSGSAGEALFGSTSRELWVRFYFWKSPGFPTPSEWMIAMKLLGQPEFLFYPSWGGLDQGGVYTSNPEMSPNATLWWNVGTTGFTFGEGWYSVIFHVRLNTVGNDDGVVQLWADEATDGTGSSTPTLRMEFLNVAWNQATAGFHGIQVAPFLKGSSSCDSAMSILFDQIVVSRGPLGPMQ